MVETDASDSRRVRLSQWVREDLGFSESLIEPASADASFRRYFRVTTDTDSYIVMDAPPDKEDSTPFVRVARLLAELDLNVPLILAREEAQGFLLLSDLGSRLYLEALSLPGMADRLYQDALKALRIMQSAPATLRSALPAYDEALLKREMELMPEWFIERHLQFTLSGEERLMLDRLFAQLTQAALAQPAAFVHRDYHSRNLLVSQEKNPGILDFQDAVWGPITYDAVSLLKDCYIAWPKSKVRSWALQYREGLIADGLSAGENADEFLRWFDLMGLQRHIKVLGIFARLFYRDGKAGYLKDLPRVLHYAKQTALAYPELASWAAFIAERIEPAFEKAQQRVLA